MTAKNIRNTSARHAWTDELVAQRAKEFVRLKSARRFAQGEYKYSCERFKTRRGIDYLDVNDPKFRRATRKAYEAFQEARAAERNALRRLETATRNWSASALNEPAKAPEATQTATLVDDFALVHDIANSIHFAPNQDAKRAIAHELCTCLLGLLRQV
ncbi:hypothetical protein [Paraburkholderia sp. MM5477-R1]|uniref:hypothetical protein n=1 Tax=Paraburkholderia sp. MM5477-R1 TaxID=2991062 RepID=UPI003D20CCA5